jgi:spermidine synthase
MLTGTVINNDRNLRLQYIAGLSLNSLRAPEIYRSIMAYRRFPEGVLAGQGEEVDKLRSRLGRRYRVF